jgi:hypothetical protein
MIQTACFATGHYEDAAQWARRSLGRRLRWKLIHVLFAASCDHLGQSDEARNAIAQLLEIWPEFSVRHIKVQFCETGMDFMERLLDGLRKAGLP